MTELKIHALAADQGGCGFYRVYEPARVTAEHGVDIKVDTELPGEILIHPNGDVDVESLDLDGVDVVIFQRPMLSAFIKAMEVAQSMGIACVVELDDHLSAVHPNNMAYHELQPSNNPVYNYAILERACDLADMVTVSTHALGAYYAKHGRFRVLPNRIPAVELLRTHSTPEKRRLGWTGTLQVHPEDLDVAGPHIASALNMSPDPNFYVVGDGEGVREKLYLAEDSEVIATGWVPREDYLRTMNEHIDVGIVPLKLDRFNQAKSWLKQLEFASQGIPTVVSGTEQNTELAQILGNPIAKRPRDWPKHLRRLMTDDDFYFERSAAVRSAVAPLTYENHAEDWIEAWESAVLHRRSQSVTVGT